MARPHETVLTVRLEPELRDAFLSEAAMSNTAPGDLLCALVKAFVDDRRAADQVLSAGYEAFLRRKVEEGLAAYAAGAVITQEDVEAELAADTERLGIARESGLD